MSAYYEQYAEGTPEGKAFGTLSYFRGYAEHCFSESEMMGGRGCYHRCKGYPEHSYCGFVIYDSAVAAATVTVSGVSETKARLHGRHEVAAMLLMVCPCDIVTRGFATAVAIGTVKSCDNGCCFVQQQLPLHGT